MTFIVFMLMVALLSGVACAAHCFLSFGAANHDAGWGWGVASMFAFSQFFDHLADLFRHIALT